MAEPGAGPAGAGAGPAGAGGGWAPLGAGGAAAPGSGSRLHELAGSGDAPGLRAWLAEHPGADLEERVGSTQVSALHEAAFSGNGEAVEVLLGAGASPSSQNKLGWGPLHWAVLSTALRLGPGDAEPGSVQALVAGQVPLDLESVHGETALDMALGMEDDGLEVAQLLTRAWDRHLCRVILCLDRYSQGSGPHGQQLPWTATQRVIEHLKPRARAAGCG